MFTRLKKKRIVLTVGSFARLVNGKEVEEDGVVLILEDIRFGVMIGIIEQQAEEGTLEERML